MAGLSQCRSWYKNEAVKSMDAIFNYKKLDDRIATSGQPDVEQVPLIIDAGYEVVIYLALEQSTPEFAQERELLASAGLVLEHIPVVWEKPLPENFAQFAAVMQKHENRRLYIHCVANKRVSVFMALYRILVLGWEEEKAMADVTDIWEPDKVWQAFIHTMLNAGLTITGETMTEGQSQPIPGGDV
jgi:protein tyrosine phosphatase (PTP) superfamily phosphohydrolase (DUF442 family)